MGCNEFLDVDVVDELQSYIERQIHSVDLKKNFNSVTAFGGGKSKVRITSGVYSVDLHSKNIVSKAVKKLSCELDQVVSHTYSRPDSANLRITSIIRDFEKTVTDMCNQYSAHVSKLRNPLSSIKLGSVYAWAREQSGANFNDLQMCSDLRKNRLRLCQKLSRLVRLSKSSKEQSQRHPLLVSLRHDLTKIRLRATGKVFTEKPVIITLPSDSTFASFEKPIIQSKLAVVFERLADQITDLLLPISHLIPGISIVKCADDAAKRRENLRAQVILAIHGFYCHFNEITEENTYEFKQNNSVMNDDPMNGSYDLSDRSESSSDDDDITGVKLLAQLSPAIVQASLDRFDHFNWNKQKQRSSSNRSKEQTMELQSINNIRQPTSSYVKSLNIKEKMKLIQSTMDNGNVEKLIETNSEGQLNNDVSMESDSEIIRTEEDEIEEKEIEENNRIDTDEEKHNKTIQHFNKSTKSHSNSSKNLITTDGDKNDKITDLFNESLEFCAKHLHDLIILAETNCHLMRKPIDINKQTDINQTKINNQLQSNFCLSSELEASIDRTATAFKEHINSVLTNLLHTASISKSSNDESKSHSQRISTITSARRQHAPSRRGSRLRGMLLAYQQDAVKKRLSSNNSD
ncbi:hypothetical protein MS3_00006033 [Schistosoma haematobium]|uniref:Uncharacterized protein n=1 Tax=Schistosoma haematobium TaxID=6185 RepID=A0A922IPT0_SCHHA|nr:hypothetical protein MS3_00006033 [Schistosoma haematobium]KAH9584427.1 hypothetical protein MS3_00006033 [Schistosoma haematobium]CAH8499974.1 unnamed protein product [Schistosoma haematobium]